MCITQHCCTAQCSAHIAFQLDIIPHLPVSVVSMTWKKAKDISPVNLLQAIACLRPDIINSLTVCLSNSGCGVGHIWLYNTKDWSCHRMEGGLLRPPVACCFCDWSDLTQPPQLFVAPGPSAAMQCLPVPDVGQVQIQPVCELHC